MNLVIDATTSQHARGGIGVVTNGLLGALADDPGGHDIRVFVGGHTEVPAALEAQRVPLIGHSAARILFQRAWLPAALRLDAARGKPAERLLLTDSYVPLWSWPGGALPVTTFVHDVLPLTHAELFTARKDLWKTWAYRSIARSRPDVVTSCDFTAAEVRRTLGVDARVALFGCGQLTDAQADAFREREAPGTRGNYLLYVGGVEPRKDLPTVIEAVAATAARHPDLKLVIVGDWRSEYGRALRRDCSERGHHMVRFLGRQPGGRVLHLLAGAQALVYPSVAEGFGLPVLEALAVGTPAIASDLPVIRSWAGDAVAYFGVRSPGELADAFAQVAGGGRAGVRQRGLELASQYRWREFARALLAWPTPA